MRITVEIGRPSLPRPRWRRLLAAAALTAVLAVPAGAVAVTGFSGFNDVPPSNPFYDAINALAGAGITTGCGNGDFCPVDNISRQAEAAFVNRGMPRAALASTPIDTTVTGGGTAAQATSVTITIGGLTTLYAAAQQFVEVHGHVAIYGTGVTGCPCNVGAFITDEAANTSQTTFSQFPSVTGYYQMDTGDVTWVFQAAPGTHTYTLWVQADGTGTLSLAQPTLIASSLPFGDTGGNSLTPQAPIAKPSGPDAAKASH